MNFKVYNRYGEMVFETYEQSIGWDGTFRNRDENSGVFQWVLEYNLANGNAGILKGNTTLIR
jgi:gliding motility-associated-like protein